MMIFAQISSTPAEVAVWLGGLAAATFVANQVLKLTDRFKERPPPAETYVAKEACAHQHAEEGRRIQALESGQETLRREIGERTDASLRRVHQRIDEMVNTINQRFDRMPKEVIEILNETGALKR